MPLRHILSLVLVLLLVCPVVADPVTVYVKPAGGKWTKTSGESKAGVVTVRLGAAEIASGSSRLVVNKPAWMVLEDTTAPKLAWVKINGKPLEPVTPDLGFISQWPLVLSLGLKDDANPLDPTSVQLDMTPVAQNLGVDVSALGHPNPNGKLTLNIPQLPPGTYSATLRVSDASPEANQLLIPLRFSVGGVQVAADQQTAELVGKAGHFRFAAKPMATLQAGDNPAAYLTINITGQHMYLDKISAVEALVDKPGEHTVKITGLVGQTDKDQDGNRLCRLEYELTLRDDLPCLLVTTRVTNLAPAGLLYCWWGWLPGKGWVDAAGAHPWSMAYKDVGKVGWVFLPQAENGPGVGWLAPGVFGESRFGTMLLFTEPQKVQIDNGAVLTIPCAFMPAATPEEVAAAAEKIRALGLW